MKQIILIICLLATISFGQGATDLLLMVDDGATTVDYEFEVDTLLANLTTPLSDSAVTKLNTFVVMLKDSLGIDSLSKKFDVMYLFANETSEAALRNLVKNANNAAVVNAPTFTAWEGFTGASTKYINTNYNPDTDRVVHTQNSNSLGVYLRTDAQDDSYDIGACTADYTKFSSISSRIATNTLRARIMSTNAGYTDYTSMTASNKFIISVRTAVNACSLYVSGIKVVNSTAASVSPPPYNYFIMSLNIAGTPNTFSVRQIAFAIIGAGLSPTEARQVNNCIEAYMDGNGKGVIP